MMNNFKMINWNSRNEYMKIKYKKYYCNNSKCSSNNKYMKMKYQKNLMK